MPTTCTENCGLWRTICGGVGIRNVTASLFRDIDPIRWRQLDHNPVALLRELTPERSRRPRRVNSCLHSRINYAYRRLQEYLTSTAHVGRRPTPACAGFQTRGLFFGRVRDLHESIPIYSGGLGSAGRRSHQECVGARRSIDRDRPVLQPGLLSGSTSTTTVTRARITWKRGLRTCRSQAALDSAGNPLTVAIQTRDGKLAMPRSG